MATKFYNTNATGANTGASWTDAWTSLASAVGLAAGDILKTEYRSSETTLAATQNFANGTLTNPVQIISCDKDNSDAPRVGAVIGWNATNTGPQGNLYLYGCSIKSSTGNFRLIPPTSGQQEYDTCTISMTGSGNLNIGDGTTIRFKMRFTNTSVDFSIAGAVSNTIAIPMPGSIFEWVGGTYTLKTSQTNMLSVASGGLSFISWRGVSVSGTVTNLFSVSATGEFSFQSVGCLAPTYTSVFSTAPTSFLARVNLDGFQSGTLTAALLPPSLEADVTGTVNSDLTRYRTGGANDGSNSNPYSWTITTNSSAAPFTTPFTTARITRWVTAGSHTITVYLASGTSRDNSGVWLNVLSPSEAGTATPQGAFRSTRAAPLATPAALTTDSASTWNGTGVGTKQKISVSISPTVAGMVSVSVNVGVASTVVYVDPEIDIDGDVNGNSRFMESVQTFSPTGGGGGSSNNFILGG